MKIIPKKSLFLIVSLFSALLILFIIGSLLYWSLSTQAVSGSPVSKTFVIQKGESISSVAQKLKDQNLIKDPFVFKIYIKLNNLGNNIQAGSFLLNPSMDLKTITQNLTKGTFDVWVTIPEGLRKEEVAALMKNNLNIDEQEFINNSREGYLFPDTYLIPKNYTAEDIIKLMEDNFQKKTATLEKTLSDRDLILASIVEREALHEKDRPLIAGILKKRVANNWPIEADATVQYVLGYNLEEKTWWKKNINQTDLKIVSPYNTRQNPGYPPTPICNPGLAAIVASQNPQDSNYWYYLSDPNGNMHYAVTLDEHNLNINKYLLTK